MLRAGPKSTASSHRIIYDELCRDVILDRSRELYCRVTAELVEHGAQAIILGCTEITLLVGQADASVPVFGTAAIHAEAAVNFLLS